MSTLTNHWSCQLSLCMEGNRSARRKPTTFCRALTLFTWVHEFCYFMAIRHFVITRCLIEFTYFFSPRWLAWKTSVRILTRNQRKIWRETCQLCRVNLVVNQQRSSRKTACKNGRKYVRKLREKNWRVSRWCRYQNGWNESDSEYDTRLRGNEEKR